MKHLHGLSLVELLVTIAILVIVLMIAVPGFRLYLISAQRTAASTQLYAALTMARSEAIAHNGRVSVCPRNDASPPACAGIGGDWNDGWLVVREADAQLLAAFEAPGSGVDVQPSVTVTEVRFSAAGRADGPICFGIVPDSDSLQPREIRSLVSGHVELREADAPCS